MKNYNGLTLAYLGDAYYELAVREYLISTGLTKVNDLHKKAITFTSGEAQASFVNYFLANGILSDIELEMYKKGRNMASSYRKNVPLDIYQKATGFETILGNLYMTRNDKRFKELFEIVKEIANTKKSGEEDERRK